MSGPTESEAIHGLNDPPIGWELHGRASLRHGKWKIVNMLEGKYGTGEWQLYDVAKDQGEVHDLAHEYPDKLEELKAFFKLYQKETGAVFGPPIRYDTGLKTGSVMRGFANHLARRHHDRGPDGGCEVVDAPWVGQEGRRCQQSTVHATRALLGHDAPCRPNTYPMPTVLCTTSQTPSTDSSPSMPHAP